MGCHKKIGYRLIRRNLQTLITLLMPPTNHLVMGVPNFVVRSSFSHRPPTAPPKKLNCEGIIEKMAFCMDLRQNSAERIFNH
jgi:hypothetical protein